MSEVACGNVVQISAAEKPAAPGILVLGSAIARRRAGEATAWERSTARHDEEAICLSVMANACSRSVCQHERRDFYLIATDPRT